MPKSNSNAVLKTLFKLLVLTVALVGCENEFKDPEEDESKLPVQETVQLTGSGQLGIIVRAEVLILDSAGNEIARSETDSLGNFGPIQDINAESPPSPIVVELSPRPEGDSVYLCDFAGGCPNPNGGAGLEFGEEVPYLSTLSAVTLAPDSITSISVNPFTTAIRVRAESLGLSAESVDQANLEMAAALSDLLDMTIPTPVDAIPNVDLTKISATGEEVSAEALALSLLNAGLISLTTSGTESVDLSVVIERLVTGFSSSGTFGVSGEFNSGEVKAGELLFGMEQQITGLLAQQPVIATAIESTTTGGIVLEQSVKALQSKRNLLAPVPPVITGTPLLEVLEDSSYVFQATAFDPDSGNLTFAITNLPAWATFNATTGVLSGTPANEHVGVSNSITISVSDGSSTVALAPFQIEVVNSNDAPMIQGVPAPGVDQGGLYTFTPFAADVDQNDTLTFSVTNLPSWMSFDTTSGTISGTPGNAHVGLYEGIQISATDGMDSTALPGFTLQVFNVNDAPLIAGSPLGSVDQDAAYSFTPVASDVDAGTTLTFTVSNLPAWLTFDPQTGTISGIATNDAVGAHTGIQVTVSDGLAIAVLPAFSLEVININDAPLISGTPSTTVNEDEEYSFTPMAIDVDLDDSLTFTVANLPVWLAFDSQTGGVSGLPTNDAVGIHAGIQISVSDGQVTTALPAFSIEVTNTNDAPLISGTPSTTVNEDAEYSFTPMALDVDLGDSLNFTVANLPVWLTFDSETGRVSGVPTNENVGVYAGIQITVSDGQATAVLPAFSIEVINTNDAPVISGTPSPAGNEDTEYSFTPTATDVDSGTTLVFSVTNLPAWLTFDSQTGRVSGVPTNEVVGVHAGIQISVSDGQASTALPAFSIEVINTNDAPLISGTPTTSANEDTEYSFTPTATDVDSGTTLTFTVTNLPAWLAFDSQTGGVSGVPSNEVVGVHAGIQISVTDGQATTALPAFSIEVINTNDAPLISGTPSTSVNEDTEYSFTPGASDVDSGTTLSFTVLNLPAWLTFDSQTGRVSGVPTNEVVGVHAGIQISVSDGQASTALPAFSIEVINTNDAPLISGTPSTSANEDTEYSFTPTATDVDSGTTLTFTVTNLPAWLTFDSQTGGVSGVPSNEVVGVHAGIQISVTDGQATTALPAFSIEVINTNDAPLIGGTPTTAVNEDTEYSFTPTASDVDSGTILTFAVANLPTWLIFDSSTGSVSGIPTNEEVGVHAGIQISVSDGQATTVLPSFSIEVINVNDAPLISGTPTTTVNEDTEYSFTPVASDVDSDTTLTFSVSNLPPWLTLNPQTGKVSGVPTNDSVGVHAGIQIWVSDGKVAVSIPAFAIEVINVNDAPFISGTPAATVNEDTEYNFTPVATDVDTGTTFTFSVVNLPVWLIFDSSTGRVSGTPSNDEVGIHAGIEISVSDGQATTNLPAFSIEVINVNDAPLISGTPATAVNEDTEYSFTPGASDVDSGTTLSFTVRNLPAWLTIDPQTGKVSGVPTNDVVGIYTGIQVSVSDGQVTATLPAFSIEVINVNDAPLISGTPATTVNEDSEYSFTPTAADVDVGDSLIFIVANLPAWMSFDSATGRVSGVPTNDVVGVHAGIQISVSDGQAATALPAFSVQVINVNDAPLISGIPTATVNEDTEYSFTPSATDVDVGDSLGFTVANLPAWLSFDSSTGRVSGIPTNDEVGVHAGIEITVSDGQATAVLPAFTIEVINVNDVPLINGIPSPTVNEDSPYSFTPSATDVDVGDSLGFTVANLPAWLTFDSATGRVSGTPTNDEVGVHAGIQISVSDGQVATALPAFSIEVINVNDAPAISGTPGTVVNQGAAYQFVPTVTDVDSSSFSFSILNKPTWTSFNAATGELSGTPDDADVGTTTGIEITVSDGSLDATLAAFNLSVLNINDAPTIEGSPALSATEDVSYSFVPTADDVDLDSGDVLGFSINKVIALDLPWASFSNETGTLTGTPGNSDVGIVDDIVISVTDSSGETADLPGFDLTVVNEALVISGVPDSSVNQDSTYTFVPSALDSEDIDTYAIANKPTWATFNLVTGELAGTPDNGDVGDYTNIVISVTDGHEQVALPAFDITVVNINDAPVIGGVPSTFAVKNQLYTFAPSASDIDVSPAPDVLVFDIVNKPSWAVFNENTGVLSGTPAVTDLGLNENIAISVSDGLLQDSLVFSIQVIEGEKVLVSWTIPTERVNGETLGGGSLVGFELEYYDEAAPAVKVKVGVDVLDQNTTSYLTDYLGSGTWHFVLTAVESDGFSSDEATADAIVDGVPDS